jgi:four helix bundle protein
VRHFGTCSVQTVILRRTSLVILPTSRGRMIIRNFEDLIVWQRSMSFAERVYRLTQTFPTHERYGLVSQLRRSSASVSANIAEGSGRFTPGEFKNALSNSRGSLKESESFLIFTGRVGYLPQIEIDAARSEADEISRMLTGLRKRFSH